MGLASKTTVGGGPTGILQLLPSGILQPQPSGILQLPSGIPLLLRLLLHLFGIHPLRLSGTLLPLRPLLPSGILLPLLLPSGTLPQVSGTLPQLRLPLQQPGTPPQVSGTLLQPLLLHPFGTPLRLPLLLGTLQPLPRRGTPLLGGPLRPPPPLSGTPPLGPPPLPSGTLLLGLPLPPL